MKIWGIFCPESVAYFFQVSSFFEKSLFISYLRGAGSFWTEYLRLEFIQSKLRFDTHSIKMFQWIFLQWLLCDRWTCFFGKKKNLEKFRGKVENIVSELVRLQWKIYQYVRLMCNKSYRERIYSKPLLFHYLSKKKLSQDIPVKWSYWRQRLTSWVKDWCVQGVIGQLSIVEYSFMLNNFIQIFN